VNADLQPSRRLASLSTAQVAGFTEGLRPIQDGDAATDTSAAMGRRLGSGHGAFEVEVADLPEWPGAPDGEDQRARFGAYALYRRAVEAATVRVHVDSVLDGHGLERRLIVLGDLNDIPQAATTQLLYGPPGSQFDTGGFDRPDQGDAWRLRNLAPRIRAEHRFSRIFEGQPELIDHILISHALLAELVSADADVSGLPASGPTRTFAVTHPRPITPHSSRTSPEPNLCRRPRRRRCGTGPGPVRSNSGWEELILTRRVVGAASGGAQQL
jgi:hypothetical protein